MNNVEPHILEYAKSLGFPETINYTPEVIEFIETSYIMSNIKSSKDNGKYKAITALIDKVLYQNNISLDAVCAENMDKFNQISTLLSLAIASCKNTSLKIDMSNKWTYAFIVIQVKNNVEFSDSLKPFPNGANKTLFTKALEMADNVIIMPDAKENCFQIIFTVSNVFIEGK